MYRKSVFSFEKPGFDAEAQSEERVSQRDFHFSSACLSLLLCASALKKGLRANTLALPARGATGCGGVAGA